jgi:8-oxo-dGTP diphosphatase
MIVISFWSKKWFLSNISVIIWSLILRYKLMRDATLCFLVKYHGLKIVEICLAMKKRGFGANRYNGIGGKVEKGESIVTGAIRESYEETGVVVKPNDMSKVAQLSFYFAEQPDWDQMVHVFLIPRWKGIPQESEEVDPKWYEIDNIPYKQMWPDDEFWLPLILTGNLVKASFTFGRGDVIIAKKIEQVRSF